MNDYNFNQQYNQPPINYQNIRNRQPTINTNKAYVNGIQDVYSRYVGPGGDFIFVDANEPILYQKIVDMNGKPEIKLFDIVPRENNQNEYVSRKEFDALQKDIQDLKEYLPKISNLGGNNEPVK